MKRFGRAVQMFALTALFALTTSASNAYDIQIGGSRFLKRQHTPVTSADLREYQALSSTAAVMPPHAASLDYMQDVSNDGIYTWEADKMPIKVFVSSGNGIPGYRPVFGTYIRTSFDWWCQASGNKLSWIEVSDPAKADITVWWTDKVFERPEGTEAGKTSCLTKLNTATRRGIIYGARMQMLTRLPGRDFGDSEVAKTCLHEAGHAFGLQGHSRVRDDIMYYAVSPVQEFTLSARDKATMSRLYANFPVTNTLAIGPKPQQQP